jgi:hypothetical protein
MNFKLSKLVWVGICGVILTWSNPLYAFMGDYNSVTGNDMAVIGGYKSTEIAYKDKDDYVYNVERQMFFIGVSKTMNSKLKLFGGFNHALDGKIDDTEWEPDNGYSLIGGVDYTFLNKNKFSVSGFGRLDYLNDDWKGDGGGSITIDGYELSTGVMGKYHLTPKVSAFATAEIIPFSDLTWKNSTNGYQSDVERDDTFGLQAGVMYDGGPWFVKGGFYMGMEDGFGLSGGMKF